MLNMRIQFFAKHYKGPKFHALLCDPPYHLTSITKRFGAGNAAPAQYGTDGAFSRVSRGFMNQTWDGGDIAFSPETWAALAEHLHPGAFGMAFASSRGWHRLAVAIEDAGLIIHPSIFGWSFGQGFPKATRIDTQIDKAAGAERESMGLLPNPGSTNQRLAMGDGWQPSPMITVPTTDLAKAWQGHRYGLQALKPALEPIIVFQKPYEGRPVDSITLTGAGALNIDGARISANGESLSGGMINGTSKVGEGWDRPWRHDPESIERNKVIYADRISHAELLGRWPANLVLDEEAARRIDAMSGKSSDADRVITATASIGYGGSDVPFQTRAYGDSGGASRFFYTYQQDSLDNADPLYYCAKVSTTERDAGLKTTGRSINDGRQTPIDNPYQRGETVRHNIHPTVKPIDLNRWLATLLLPPEAYSPRRILIPFAGVGSEMIGAMQARWDEITGIEMTREYAAIARARLEFWSKMGVQLPLFGTLAA